MKITKIGATLGSQDGAIRNGILFKFNGRGLCKIYETERFSEISEVTLADKLIPHSNAVSFGTEYFEAGDEFPLLYTNVYNNYAKEAEVYKGTCLVYRILREGNNFSFELKQIIRLGFCEDEIWCSKDGDVRPYGNFTVDRDNNRYYAFNMMDGIKKTRYFEFRMPKLSDGFEVILNKKDIIRYFDVDYHNYIQGATVYKNKIYSVEGGTDNPNHPAAIRIIDLQKEKQVFYALFRDYIEDIEPEFIDFYKDICYYGDTAGNLYTVDFDI